MSDVKNILVFILEKPRTKTEIQNHFFLSNTEVYSRLRFLRKCGDIEVIRLMNQQSKGNNVFIYQGVKLEVTKNDN